MLNKTKSSSKTRNVLYPDTDPVYLETKTLVFSGAKIIGWKVCLSKK